MQSPLQSRSTPIRASYACVPLVLVVIGTGVVSACAGAPVVDCLSPSAAREGFQHCRRECQPAQCVCGPCPCGRRFSEKVSQSHSHTTGRSTLQPCVMSSSVILMNVALEWGQPVIYPTAPLHSCVPSGSMCVRPSSSLSSASESGRSVNGPNVQSVATSVDCVIQLNACETLVFVVGVGSVSSAVWVGIRSVGCVFQLSYVRQRLVSTSAGSHVTSSSSVRVWPSSHDDSRRRNQDGPSTPGQPARSPIRSRDFGRVCLPAHSVCDPRPCGRRSQVSQSVV